ncbi:tetratricopeptide repeat-containing diguanylate cyclase [Desulfolutivibrio sulfoxidireducens]|uniref:tetratricopeptide repeat-containing diguanylate cyclase n=1 Tax=Desulfolutivibrio sulfoxidireducens TaxID=2773299 RepID=UPI00210A4F78|nr:tetratricopeptide repeat protein [Desulfolutivibrio sulfoxidireducens]
MRRQWELLDMGRVKLTPQDLITFEHFLKDALSAFLPFRSSSLYFPQSLPGDTARSIGADFNQAVHLPEEGRVLLPLAFEGGLLGVFVAKGVRMAAPRTQLAALPAAAALCLEQIRLYKAAVADPVTGLSNLPRLLAAMEREIDLVQDRILPGSASYFDPNLTGVRGCFGLILVDIDYFNWVNERYGFVFAESALDRVGAAISLECPQETLAARIHDDVFALFLPGATPAGTRETAEAVRMAVKRLRLEYGVTGETIALTASAGFANYPQDVRGGQFVAPVAEQARIMLKKARKALAAAKDLGRDQTMPFGRVLAEGGLVLETLPLDRVTVSLGKSVDAEGGQRFLVWSPRYEKTAEIKKSDDQRLIGRYPTMIKGEVALMDVREDMAFAEILHVSDPSWTIDPGDRLLLAPETSAPDEPCPPGGEAERPPRKEAISGLYGHRDFPRFLSAARENVARFCLALVLLPDAPAEGPSRPGRHVESDIREVTAIVKGLFGPGAEGGRFSTTKLAFYLPDREPDQVMGPLSNALLQARERLGIEAAAGVAGYPFLAFSKADAMENCRKALHHALLLPTPPRIAVFDSISLTISADRLFALGDIYAAMEEYKQALLADETNVLARNSLGICLAKLGSLAQAKAEFEKVIARDPKNAMALYNYGCLCRRLGENALARKAFKRCLGQNPGDVFSLLRLGRMAEETRRYADALTYYKRAEAVQNGVSMRHMARLAIKRKRPEEAREYLHQALVHDPKDAFSLSLMARLYLDGGEDPAIAEVMARQSVALRPDRKEFWTILARALSALGKDEEAKAALTRAGGG